MKALTTTLIFWNVKLVVRGTASVKKEQLWEDMAAENREGLKMHALKILGDEVTYERVIVQVGVREHEVDDAVARHVALFEKNALLYLAPPAFPPMMVKRRWDELVREVRIMDSRPQQSNRTKG